MMLDRYKQVGPMSAKNHYHRTQLEQKAVPLGTAYSLAHMLLTHGCFCDYMRRQRSTPPPASSSTKAALPVTTSASPLELHRTSLSVGAIIGAVLGGIMVVLLMLLLVRSFWYRRKSGQGSGHASSDPDPLLDATDDTDVTQMAQEIPPVLDISMATLLSIAPATPTMPALRSSTASPTLHSSCPPSSNELTLLGLSAVGDGIVSTSTGGKSSRFSDPYPARPPVIAAGIATAVPLYEGHTSDPGMRSTLPSESSVTLVSDPPPPYMAD
ncbi:hypothetical protein SCP_0904720 [Sparassis crispa]|uniref:Mid2 domain-containing protein n=1 Tax=Sparassis crispa TaxID=139825 RepID=A0A401GWN5_9APHY|nr:hypothetical protein SCP_0904720 [Sparassis crispa]GBE86593.1 hypothetical protein SCP_0904720 [Sparassis crispa]